MRPKFTALRPAAATTEKLCSTGKRNAVDSKSRSAVVNSALVLRRPKGPPTAGRKPAASPPSTSGVGFDVGAGADVGVAGGVDVGVGSAVDGGVLSSQLKSWAVGVDADVATQSNSRTAVSACAPPLLSDSDINELRTFFESLDQWDRGRVE